MSEVDYHDMVLSIWPDLDAAPRKTLSCRHCSARNRVAVPTAVLWPHLVRCGSCDGELFLPADQSYEGLASRAYEHPMDRDTLRALQAVPGFPVAVRKFVAVFSESAVRVSALSSHIRIDEEQFPELHTLMREAAQRLDYQLLPTLFLVESPVLNAMTLGAERPLILVHGALLDQLHDPELSFVLGHELGHLHADHVVYKVMARMVVEGSMALGDVFRLLSMPLRMALLAWDRASELSADRAGLLATRDLPAALGALMTLSGGRRPGITRRTELSLGAFVRQARDLHTQGGESRWDGTLGALLGSERSHPFTTLRVMHLLDWVERGAYLEILAGDYPREGA